MPLWRAPVSLGIFEWALRATVMYAWLLITVKLKGQWEIGRLNASDFVVAVAIGSVAAGVLNNPRLGLTGALTPLGTLALIDIAISYGTLRHSKFRRIVQGEPIVLVLNGGISVIPKSQARPSQPRDLGMDTPYEGLPQFVMVQRHEAGEVRQVAVNLTQTLQCLCPFRLHRSDHLDREDVVHVGLQIRWNRR